MAPFESNDVRGRELPHLATKIGSILTELKRRNVFKVAVAYGVVAWLLIQAAAIVLPTFGLPAWTVRLVIVLVVIAFPVALVLAWAYELTPEGIRPTQARSGSSLAAPAGAAAAPPRPGAALPAPVATALPSHRTAAETPPAETAVGAGLGGSTRVPGDSALAAIVVLRFENLTPGSPHAYLADAISIELHSLLSRVHRLRVVSRQSAAAHADAKHDLKKIARELDVEYVISGSVAEFDGRVQVNVELDDALDDALLWSERYDVAVEQASGMQREIVETVVSVFGGERLRAEIKHANETASGDAAAWQIVQKARAYLLDYKPETVAAAIPLLQQAVAIDPDYATAHAMLGLVTAEMTLNAISVDPEADRRAAIEAVSRAEQLAPRDPVVLRAAGCVRAYTGAYRAAISILTRAAKLAPYDLGTWGYLGWPLVATGDPADLVELHEIIDRLLRVSARHPGRAYWLFHKSVAQACQDRCEEAAGSAEEYIADQPRFVLGWLHYANVLGRLGRLDAARAAVERAGATQPRMTPAYYIELMSVLTDRAPVIDKRTSGLRAAGLA